MIEVIYIITLVGLFPLLTLICYVALPSEPKSQASPPENKSK